MREWALEMIEKLVARGEELCARVIADDYNISLDTVEEIVKKYK